MGLTRQIIWLVLSLFVTSVAAQEPPKPQTLGEAEAQRQRASAMREEADKRYEAEAGIRYAKLQEVFEGTCDIFAMRLRHELASEKGSGRCRSLLIGRYSLEIRRYKNRSSLRR